MGASTPAIEQLAHDVAQIPNPETALRALTALRQELETMEPSLVQRALRGGASWSQIARALGVSKQAAHRKYRYLSERPSGAAAGSPKLLVTAEARRCIHFAREEATRLGQPAIGTEHILLGILRCEDSPAARALGVLGVTHHAASECLRTTLPGVPPGGQPAAAASGKRGDGVSDHARRILEGSLREALKQGDENIGVEHLLLALLADSRNGAVQTLEALRATPAKIRSQLQQESSGAPEPAVPDPRGLTPPAAA